MCSRGEDHHDGPGPPGGEPRWGIWRGQVAGGGRADRWPARRGRGQPRGRHRGAGVSTRQRTWPGPVSPPARTSLASARARPRRWPRTAGPPARPPGAWADISGCYQCPLGRLMTRHDLEQLGRRGVSCSTGFLGVGTRAWSTGWVNSPARRPRWKHQPGATLAADGEAESRYVFAEEVVGSNRGACASGTHGRKTYQRAVAGGDAVHGEGHQRSAPRPGSLAGCPSEARSRVLAFERAKDGLLFLVGAEPMILWDTLGWVASVPGDHVAQALPAGPG